MPRIAFNATALDAMGSMPAPEAKAFVYRKRETKVFRPSPQQLAVFDHIEDPKGGNAFVEAVAGAGKTTTLIQAIRRTSGSVFFGAYNNKIAKEIKAKLVEAGLDRQGVFVSTMHGAGLSNWKRSAKGENCVLDEKKVERMVKAGLDGSGFADFEGYICKMIGLGKQFLIGCGVGHRANDYANWLRIAEHYGCDTLLPESFTVEQQEILLAYLAKFYLASAQATGSMDYDDMIFLPLYHNVRFWQNDWVFLDEAQDTNPARRELARRMLRTNGRLLAVGDPRQAIYGFTGADADSVERIVTDFACKRLPLTVTYRCPKAVVNYVHQWVSHIEAHPDAPEGEVRTVEAPQADMWNKFDPKAFPPEKAQPWFIREAVGPADAILCRYTRPLVETAFAMLRAGIGCKVEGRDIGHGLIKLARRWRVTDIISLEQRLARYLEKETAKAGDNEARKQSIEDVVGTLRVFIGRAQEQGKTRIDDVVEDIQALFADDVTGVTTLCSGHKSKGREWPRVYWLQRRGTRPGLKPWELVQEDNINYVIGTRAQELLGLVPEGMV